MQDKELADEAEEALTSKSETGNTVSDRRDSLDKKDSYEGHGKRESNKDGKFAFRRMKQSRKEKTDKNSPSRFEGDGVAFKAKLIGLEAVSDARGDKMCQEAMQRLKLNVRNTGPHKRKINICISLQGIKIKEEKSGKVIYHHPVSLISFISQDITDARAFGYVFGSTDEPHQFIAIKTEKPAFHVVLALRDLFQTVLNHKQEEIDIVKENKTDVQKIEEALESKEIDKITSEKESFSKNLEEPKRTEETIYFEVLLTEPLKMREEVEMVPDSAKDMSEPIKSIDDLLGLQNELNKLQQGIEQMDTSIAAAAAFNLGVTAPENDPFDTSFVLGPKRDSFPLPMPTPVPLVTSVSPSENQQFHDQSAGISNEDKYAVFNTLNSGPSVFENSAAEAAASADIASSIPDIKDLEEEILKKTPAPAKPPRQSKSASPDQSIFADLDPLGKDRPYKDKAEFFQDVKNPPKKVLNDLFDKSSSSCEDSSKIFDANLMSSSVAFPVDFESASPPSFVSPQPAPLSSSLPNSFSINSKLSVAYAQNGNSPYNPFEQHETVNSAGPHSSRLTTRGSDPIFNIVNSPQSKILSQNNIINNNTYLGKSPPANAILGSTQQLTVNCTMANSNSSQFNSQQNTSSSPIPIPPRQTAFGKERSFSNGSISSPYSKSPAHCESESPNHADYFAQNHNCSEGYSPIGLTMKNGLGMNGNLHLNNGENGSCDSTIPLTNGNSVVNKSNMTNGFSNFPKTNTNGNSQNGVSRPRPRPSLSKGASVPSNGHTFPSQALINDPSTDNEIISKENMQSITNMLITNGHRLRAQSHNDYKLQLPGEKNIFAKKNDPFADDFFYSLPKKPTSHIAKTEIPEYV